MTTNTLPVLEVRTGEQPAVCESCGQALPASPDPRELEVTPATIADVYRIWQVDTRRRNRKTRPILVLVVRRPV